MLADFPRLGSVCRIHSCSYRSIRQIHPALQEIQTFTGGRLAGITAKLTVRPEEATYFDRKEKRKKTTSIWALSLEVDGDDVRKLIANLTANARLFAETRKLLGSGGKVFEVVEDEGEQAPEVAAEYYPATANGDCQTIHRCYHSDFCAPEREWGGGRIGFQSAPQRILDGRSTCRYSQEAILSNWTALGRACLANHFRAALWRAKFGDLSNFSASPPEISGPNTN